MVEIRGTRRVLDDGVRNLLLDEFEFVRNLFFGWAKVLNSTHHFGCVGSVRHEVGGKRSACERKHATACALHDYEDEFMILRLWLKRFPTLPKTSEKFRKLPKTSEASN